MSNPVPNIQPTSPGMKGAEQMTLVHNLLKKGTVPPEVVVQHYMNTLATQMLHDWGENIKEQGTRAKEIDQVRSIVQERIRSTLLSADNARVERISQALASLPSSFYLAARAA